MPGVRLAIPNEERHRLIAGPYVAPKVEQGEQMLCALHGAVTVSGWSEAPLPWPVHRALHIRTSLIVSEELVRALRTESVTAVSYWWNISVPTVKRWKRALGIGRTEGSQRLRQLVVDAIASDERIREWRRQHPHTKDPEVRAKISKNARRFLSPEHRRKLSEAARRRVMAAPPEVRRAAAELMRQAKRRAGHQGNGKEA